MSNSLTKKIKIALAGNPNAGKSTIFNLLTGSHQHVGNYPGVTVEKKIGHLSYKEYSLEVIELPGIYSMTAHSPDEVVARNFLVYEKPDVVINVVDSSNLERNLYLSTQIIEMGVPILYAFNMYDEAQEQGLIIDKDILARFLGGPIEFTIGIKREGKESLLDRAIEIVEGKIDYPKARIGYGKEINEEIDKIETLLLGDESLRQTYPTRWLAIKMLEQDKDVLKIIEGAEERVAIAGQLEKSLAYIEGIFDDRAGAIIAERRYGFISGACSEAIRKNYEVRHNLSDKIDSVLINRALGLPIFLFLMWGVFKLTFALSEPMMRGIEWTASWLGRGIAQLLPKGSPITSFIVDGVIGGVGSVLTFVPIIFLLFFAIAILEDSGYMSRGAFIMDRLMHKMGLHGNSFIPLLIGFGCNVPAIMAARTIEDKRGRLITILIAPFMSCGARLPIYILLIGAFFPKEIAGDIIFSLYMVGMLVAVIVAKILRKYILKGPVTPFVMELPPYRMPTMRGLLVHVWDRGGAYLKKAGSLILLGSIIVWFISNFPWNPLYSRDYLKEMETVRGDEVALARVENEMAKEKLEKSLAGRFGRLVVPIFRPLGLEDWRVPVSLVGGVAAKEIVVSTMGTLYSVGESDAESASLRENLRRARTAEGRNVYTPLSAYALMIFVLLYCPCSGVIAVTRKETGSFAWPIIMIGYTTTIAWLLAFVVYQGGSLLGLG
ncbi:MAG: ferrous iron transport protein B [Nitrospinota bacterium]